MRTYVRARTGDQRGGAPARRRRRERLRGRAAARDRRARPCATGAGRRTVARLGPRARAAASGSARSAFIRDPWTTPSCSVCIWATATSAQLARTQRLRISLDARYPAIVDDTEALLRRCFPDNQVGRVASTTAGWSCSTCTAGISPACCRSTRPGKKHHRRDRCSRTGSQSIVGRGSVARSSVAASARTDVCSSTAPAHTSTSATASPTSRPTSSTSFESTCLAHRPASATLRDARSGSIDERMSHACSSTSASSPEPAKSLPLLPLRLWWNW